MDHSPIQITPHGLALLWASPAPPHLKRGLHEKAPSPPDPPLKPSYSQIVKTKIAPRDSGKRARDPGKVTRDASRGPLPTSVPRNQSHDLTRSCNPTQPRDQARFGRATHPLTNTWKTMGTSQRSTRSQGIPHSLSPMDTGTSNILIGLRA